ncbi:V-type ATPase assembly factor PKR1 [Psilocybe cubensis]|uniref:V-type ATPase assembly factor PKR1 n=2 Tax=Psilocybe cubensis TaxID=181762 RepID=A0ACB8H5I4_PSICU|nr:V-type ATPase assembly factor PKR1 [Psilocybe cubensis]KAH9483043.1 V-type ATPase assembly factor PKR1 [Psilocybe cubensis]
MAQNESSTPAKDTPFFSNILQPGSSLHPTFLLFVDGAFSVLLVVFLILIFLTSGNPHIFALIAIELCLWASVKWFVNELKKVPVVEKDAKEDEKEDTAKETESKKTI